MPRLGYARASIAQVLSQALVSDYFWGRTYGQGVSRNQAHFQCDISSPIFVTGSRSARLRVRLVLLIPLVITSCCIPLHSKLSQLVMLGQSGVLHSTVILPASLTRPISGVELMYFVTMRYALLRPPGLLWTSYPPPLPKYTLRAGLDQPLLRSARMMAGAH